jgi:hypothetical protein
MSHAARHDHDQRNAQKGRPMLKAVPDATETSEAAAEAHDELLAAVIELLPWVRADTPAATWAEIRAALAAGGGPL